MQLLKLGVHVLIAIKEWQYARDVQLQKKRKSSSSNAL